MSKKPRQKKYTATLYQQMTVMVPVTVEVKAKNEKEAKNKVKAMVKAKKDMELTGDVSDTGDLIAILEDGKPTGKCEDLDVYEEDEDEEGEQF